MKKMRWLLAWLVLFCLGLTNAYGQQFWEGSVYNDTLATMVPGVVNFDWSSSGSGVAEGLAPAGSPLVVGQEFTMRYQSYLVKLEDVAGQPINFPGLNTAFEYTVVAEIPQKIAAFIPGTTQISVFSTLPGGRFFIYHDSEPNNNVLSGLGFDDGDLVASGVIDAGVATSLTYLSATNQAIGSTTLTGAVSYANPQFIDPALNIVSLRLETTVNFPPLESTTTNFFVSRPGEGNLDPYAVQTDDLLLKLDASSKFLVQDACIELIKEVSVDGGTNWYDANTLEEAPGTTNGALYRFTVTNCGSTDLTGVVISDPTLGLDGLVVGDLPAGESRTVNYSLDFPNSLLSNPGLCDDVPPPGDGDPNKYNEATVVGTIADTDLTVTDSDPAWVKCICLDIEKLVSVDGGMTFEDADQCFDPAAPVAAGAVEYQLVVTNCGSVTLDDLTVTDALLGVNEYVNGLEPGSSQTWTGTELPEALYVDDFCAVFGEKLDANRNLLNTAVASATALGQYTLRDEDSACVSCLCSGTIGDFVWDDLDRDGIQDAGEPGIAGVSVTLSGNGIEPVTVQTATDGSYLFTDLCAGTYTVTVTTPDGYTATMPNAPGSTTDNDSNGSPADVTLSTDNSSDLSIDFGFYTPCTGSIGDYVWNDIDQDGIQDAPLETGIAGVTVNLLQGGAVIGTTMTDSNGFYLFSDLCAGTYAVTVATPDGYTASPSLQGGDTAMDSNGSPATVTLTTDNSSDPTIDFGFYLMDAKIGDYVWLDENRNGIQDADEDGLSGVAVNLLDCDGNLIETTSTDSNGYYSFTVEPGDYMVQFVAPLGYSLTLPNVGNDANDSDAADDGMTICTTLAPGEIDLTWDAGMYPMPGSIGDYVWNDLNKDGIQNDGDTGIAGVTVKLIDCTTNLVVATTTTGTDGKYLFEGLMPGSYRVEFVAPMGYDFTTPNVGNDAADSDANASGVTECYDLAAGQTNLTVDAGLWMAMPSIDIEKFVKVCESTPQESSCEYNHDGHEYGDHDVEECDYNRDGKCDTGDRDYCDKNSYSCQTYDKYHCDYDGDDDCDDRDRYTCDKNRDGYCNYRDKESCFNHPEEGDSTTPTSSCGKVSFKFVITNSGPVTLTNLTLDDNVYNVSGCILPASLAPGESYACEIGPFPAEAGQHTNTATATGFYMGTTVTDTDNANYFGGTPSSGCVRSPGYWKNHPEAWPVSIISIGGHDYTMNQAIAIMDKPVAGDKSYTLFPALVAAKLDVLSGANDDCIAETIIAADAWMFKYPVGSGVTGDSDAWMLGESLYLKLDQYINGELCASYCGEPVPPTPTPSNPAIDVEKFTNGFDADVAPGPYVSAGETVKWEYVVKNKGDVALSGIKVTDDKVSSVSCPKTSLQPGESITCSASGSAISGQYVNTGSVVGYAGSVKVSDSDKSHYYGSKTQTGCGTGTPGYWKNHPAAWPVSSIVIGGVSYAKDQAIAIIAKSVAGDKTYTMFPALVSAKLNVLTGTNSSCVSDTISSADAWLKTYKVGSGVQGDSAAWKIGEPLSQLLDSYNNGLLCAPHRDSTKDQCASSWVPESKVLVCEDDEHDDDD